MSKNNRRRFNNEFNLDAAQLVVNQGYSTKEAAEAIKVGYSTMDNGFASCVMSLQAVQYPPNQ